MSTIETMYKAVSEAQDQATLTTACLNQLGALFAAIKDKHESFTNTHNLASLGHYVATDLAELCGSNAESLEKHYMDLRQQLGYK